MEHPTFSLLVNGVVIVRLEKIDNLERKQDTFSLLVNGVVIVSGDNDGTFASFTLGFQSPS